MKSEIRQGIQKSLMFLTIAAIAMLLTTSPAIAQGLTHAEQATKNWQNALEIWVPMVATVVLIVIGALYFKKMVQKDTVINFFIGCVLAGSASEIVGMMFF